VARHRVEEAPTEPSTRPANPGAAATPRKLGRMSYGANPKRSEECPVRREDVGASAGGQSWGLCQPDEGVRPLGDLALPCSPPRSRSLRLAREREAGVRGSWMLPSANADAPTSLSNVLLL
jgi:hypothetical protein